MAKEKEKGGFRKLNHSCTGELAPEHSRVHPSLTLLVDPLFLSHFNWNTGTAGWQAYRICNRWSKFILCQNAIQRLPRYRALELPPLNPPLQRPNMLGYPLPQETLLANIDYRNGLMQRSPPHPCRGILQPRGLSGSGGATWEREPARRTS